MTATALLSYLLHYAIARTVYDWIGAHGGWPLIAIAVGALLLVHLVFGRR